MRFSARHLPAVLLLILNLPTSLWAQAASKQTGKTPRGSISGRVTIKEKGVAGVVIVLRKGEFVNPYEPTQRATTDQDGFYRITNVPPGAYDVSPSAPAFVPASGSEPRGRSVLVGDDENVEGINFALVRGGVITGRVTDADRRPVIQQLVFIYRTDVFEQQSPQRTAFATSSVQTDDRGIYRVFGLMPGRYKVGVGRSDDVFNPSFNSGRSTYKQVFHPDVSDQAKATVIEVAEGTEANNVDIALGRALQTFMVAGRVVDGEKGLPVPNIRLGMQRNAGEREEFVSTFATSNTQGDFVVEGLIPGKYGIYLFPNQHGGIRAETLTFDIIDQDLSGLTVKIVQGVTLSGAVVVETENKAAVAKFPELQIRGFVPNATGGSGIASGAVSPIAPDGSFQLTGLPGGTVTITVGAVSSPYPPKGFNITRIERDGVTVTRGIEIKEGEQLTGIRVVLAYGTAALRGVVKLANGTLPEGSRIFVRLQKSGDATLNKQMQADTRGYFMMEGLPAGTYEVQVFIPNSGQVRPPIVKREVVVQEAITTDVTLTVDMSASLKP